MRRATPAVRDERRVEFGDWQTPDALADAVLRIVSRNGTPAAVLEPTCGEGSFLAAAAQLFPHATLAGFDISKEYVDRARMRLPVDRSSVHVADFFEVQWERIVSGLDTPLLVVGNPPWVTNAALGGLDAENLPVKANFKRLTGMDAMTGKSNFDISEWMLIRLVEVLRERDFTLAMLCKASVARRVMEYATMRGWNLGGEVRAIDARLHFAAAVDAVMIQLWQPRTTEARGQWPVFDSLDATEPSRLMGVVDGRIYSDIKAYAKTKVLEGSASVEWRSGLKHDCSKVMELDMADGALVNGFGEFVEIERENVFPLLKGSDVANGRLTPRKAVIVTQRRLGDDTRSLRDTSPKLWEYLSKHRSHLDARKSSIYRDQPPFAIFGIGEYSFAPYKVAICGLYKRLAFSLLSPVDDRPVMVDDTVYFLPCSSEREAEQIVSALSSTRAQEYFGARIFWDAKRPIGKAVLQSLSLDRLLATDSKTMNGRRPVSEQQILNF